MEHFIVSVAAGGVAAFQSLVGIRINWNSTYTVTTVSEALFQSLVGIRINWNSLIILNRVIRFKFQSLVGIRINWNFIGCFFCRSIASFNP